MEINVKFDLNNAEYSIPDQDTMVFIWYTDELLMWEGRFLGEHDGKRVFNDYDEFVNWKSVRFWINSDVFRDKIKECME